jgi:hypothetical protein
MTAPQSSGIEAIRADIQQDATHPKKHPMRRMGCRANTLSLSLTAMLFEDFKNVGLPGQSGVV